MAAATPFVPPVAPPWGIMGLEYDEDGGYYLRISPEYLYWLMTFLNEDCCCPKANGCSKRKSDSGHDKCIDEAERFTAFVESLRPILSKAVL